MSDINEMINEAVGKALTARAEWVETELEKAVVEWDADHGPSVFMRVEGPFEPEPDYQPPGYEWVHGWKVSSDVGGIDILQESVSLWARPRRWWSISDRRQRRRVRAIIGERVRG